LDARNRKEVRGAALYFMEFLFQHLDLAGCGILSISTGRNEMPDEPSSPTLDRGLTTNIVAAYVRHNQIGADLLSVLISTVHQALVGLGKPAAEHQEERTPAVPIGRSVHRGYVVCLECGWRGQMLKRHLATGHGLTVEQYRGRWNLRREHPMTAPAYSERRSGLAKQIGLGRGRRASRDEPEPVATETPSEPQPRSRRRGRPRSTATAT
jgi:predicted transcriptional regulator